MPGNAGPDTSLGHVGQRHETFFIAGIPVHVFGLAAVQSRDVTVLFFLHGRLGKWEDSIGFIDQTLNTVKAGSRSLIIVTFDQRK